MWIIPIVLALGVVANLASTKWGEIDQVGTYVMWLAIGCVGVGFNEEMITRGLLIVGARGTLHEGWVWFVRSLLFGLLHVPNAFFGQSVKDTVQQVFFAFGIGTAYYVTRRISGALVVTMVLHGAWDFSVFIQGHSVDLLADKPVAIGGIVMMPVVALSLLRRLAPPPRRRRRRRAGRRPARRLRDRRLTDRPAPSPSAHDLPDHAPTVPSAP